jgi:CheY-like chemotaxis protein
MTPPRGTVLVVDDDFDVRESLAEILRDEGYEVATAADGDEGLAWLGAHAPPSLILLDWMMPRCDGAQFRARQAADARLASIPVVVLTADLRISGKAHAVGASAFLPKPVTIARLLDAVRQHAKPPPS